MISKPIISSTTFCYIIPISIFTFCITSLPCSIIPSILDIFIILMRSCCVKGLRFQGSLILLFIYIYYSSSRICTTINFTIIPYIITSFIFTFNKNSIIANIISYVYISFITNRAFCNCCGGIFLLHSIGINA